MNAKEFTRRRRQLMRMMGKGGIAILPAAPPKIRNRDAEFPYRQDSDFIYLSGFEEPEAVAVLIPGRSHGEYVVFCRERDPVRETWDGRRAGPEGAVEHHAADDAFPIGDIDDILPGPPKPKAVWLKITHMLSRPSVNPNFRFLFKRSPGATCAKQVIYHGCHDK